MPTTLMRGDGRALTFDLTTRITFSPSVTVTSHPVEDGVDISDHARVNQLRVSLKGLVTETPFRRAGVTGGEAHVLAAIRFLNESAGQQLTLVTERRGTHRSLLLEQWPHDLTVVRNAIFDISLVQVRVASTTSASIDVESPVDESSTGGEDYSVTFADETDSGEQATTVIDEEDPEGVEQDSSALYDLASYIGG